MRDGCFITAPCRAADFAVRVADWEPAAAELALAQPGSVADGFHDLAGWLRGHQSRLLLRHLRP